jgi:hypothetical protein
LSGHERERLSAYLDRELPGDERAAVEAHLSACPECAAFLAELSAVDGAAASLPAEPPEGYFESFPARVRSRLEPRRGAVPRVPAWAWAAAAALVLAVITPLTLRQLRPAPAEESPAPRRSAASAPAPKQAEEKPRAEPPSALSLPPSPRAKDGPAPRATRVAPAPVAPAPVPPAAPPEAAEADFAQEPALQPQAPAQAVAARDETAARRAQPGEGSAENRAAPAGPGRRAATAQSAAEAGAPAPSEGKAGLAVGALEETATEDTFRRLDAARPRSVEEWRRLRDEWNAFAASRPGDPRADEARVRAILASRQAWLSGGGADDETAFRRDVAGYLERTDALQKDRVKRLLAEPPRR